MAQCTRLSRVPCHCAEYAQVTRMLGNGRLEAFCFDGVNRLCHIRGKLRKRVWIGVGDIVLLGLREFQDQKCARLPACPRTHVPPPLRSLTESPRKVKHDASDRHDYYRPLPDRADIILKYDGDEARSLKTYGELPDTVQINAGTEMLEGEDFGDDNFDFDEDADGADERDELDDI
jgi:translation initiation factor 1A